MTTNKRHSIRGNIFDIFSGLLMKAEPLSPRIVRISPETDGISMLFSNFTSAKKLYRMKLVCWAIREDGSIDGMAPWFDGLSWCGILNSP